MADSRITKRALAESLKELMIKEDFNKISVADICNQCGMNRKSFYYHFKDKYDLVNWIFDIEFLSMVSMKTQKDSWELLEEMCMYFYENKKFYRSALKIEGQNSFKEHFNELLIPIVEEYIKEVLGEEESMDFYVDFCKDAFVGALQRWIMDKKDMEPHTFLNLLKKCIHIIAVRDKEWN